MGKLIPKVQTLPGQGPEARREQAGPPPGPLAEVARDFKGTMKDVEARYELDELDRMARRYARGPASGAAEALDALAVVVSRVPQRLRGSEVNLDPGRLRDIADRERGLRQLRDATERFLGLVKDSQQEQGDEIVELLVVGYGLIKKIATLPSEDETLRVALRTLAAYHQRAADEDAHKGDVERGAVEGPRTRRKGAAGPGKAMP